MALGITWCFFTDAAPQVLGGVARPCVAEKELHVVTGAHADAPSVPLACLNGTAPVGANAVPVHRLAVALTARALIREGDLLCRRSVILGPFCAGGKLRYWRGSEPFLKLRDTPRPLDCALVDDGLASASAHQVGLLTDYSVKAQRSPLGKVRLAQLASGRCVDSLSR